MPMYLNSSGDDSAYEDSRIMPDADGTEDMHDMDLDASAMDQDGERPGEGSLCDSCKFHKSFTEPHLLSTTMMEMTEMNFLMTKVCHRVMDSLQF